jgi:predicted transcriptional regulator
MKATIEIPEAVFHAMERLARRTERSRDQIYVEAFEAYLLRHSTASVTDAMNRLVDGLGDEPSDPFQAHASRRVMKKTDW